jgi:hypothetical protein
MSGWRFSVAFRSSVIEGKSASTLAAESLSSLPRLIEHSVTQQKDLFI